MSFIQNLFSSRDNNANGANYVGQQDRIWWNPDTNAFYYSDGNTPGGILIGTGGGGNGLPAGPINSIQINAGNGSFTGSSNLIFNGTVVSIVGNVSANYFIGDGSQLTNLPIQPGTYGNANVADYLPTYTGDFSANNISIGTLYSPNFYSNAVAFANATGTLVNSSLFKYNPGTEVLTVGSISTTGNVSSNFFIGDGSQLTNLPLGNYSGNISGGNITITNTANLGNFTIYDQTLSGTIDNRDVNILVVGNADINMGGGFNIHSSGNIENTAEFQVAQDGQVTMLVPTPDQYAGAVRIIGSSTGVDVPAQNYGVMLHTTGQPSTPSRFYNDGVANYAAYIGRRYNGTSEAPTGVLNNQILSRIGATPYLTDDTWPTVSTTRIDFITTENQTTSAQGSKIQMWATPNGNTTPGLVADFGLGGINLTGNLIPTIDNIYSLGNITNRWIGAYFGNAGIYIQDTTLGTTGSMSLDNGQMLFDDNIESIQVGPAAGNAIQLHTDGIKVTNSALDINMGTVGDTGNTHILNAGIKFLDDTVQTTAAIPLTQKGVANGVATLGSDGKVTPSELPAGSVFFKGTWDASTNTPTLVDGVGTAGWEYQCTVAGTVDFGTGPIAFNVGDFVIYNGALWQRIPGGTGVTSFNTRTGAVVLSSGDVTNALSNGSITNNYLANTGVTINTGAGLSGGGPVSLGGILNLAVTGVVNILAGTGVNVVTSLGNSTISIGQPVGTANSVQFFAVTANTTVQATGNVTGGNITTAGRIVATGNIVTQANVVTPGTIVNSGVSTSGNVTGANILTVGQVSATGNGTFGNINVIYNTNTANLTVTGITNLNSNANVHISGGGPGQTLTTDGTGNLSWTSPTAGNIITLIGNTTPNIDFTYNTTTLIYLPTGNVTVNLANYTSGHTARLIIRFGAPYTVNMGVGNIQQTTEGTLTLPTSGAGGHKIVGNQSIQLLYTCFDNTAGNCYVASTFL